MAVSPNRSTNTNPAGGQTLISLRHYVTSCLHRWWRRIEWVNGNQQRPGRRRSYRGNRFVPAGGRRHRYSFCWSGLGCARGIRFFRRSVSIRWFLRRILALDRVTGLALDSLTFRLDAERRSILQTINSMGGGQIVRADWLHQLSRDEEHQLRLVLLKRFW